MTFKEGGSKTITTETKRNFLGVIVQRNMKNEKEDYDEKSKWYFTSYFEPSISVWNRLFF